MKLRTIKYYFKEALKSMKRNGLMTLASISTVALSLFMLGVFLCGVINLNNMASSLENQVQLSIYLKDGLTTDQIMAVGKQIKAIPNLKHLEFVNKEQAMKEFKERLGDQQQLVNALGDVNPLPNSYVLTFDKSDCKISYYIPRCRKYTLWSRYCRRAFPHYASNSHWWHCIDCFLSSCNIIHHFKYNSVDCIRTS